MCGKPVIIAFTTSYYPFIGGAEIAIQETLRRLSQEFDFLIVCARMQRGLAPREERREGTVVRLGFGMRWDKWFLPVFALLWYLRNVTRLTRFNLVTILWGIDISQGALGAALIKLFSPRTPFIFTIQYGESETRLASGRGGFIAKTFRFMLSQADEVTAISAYLLNLAREYGYCGPAAVVHNGVDIVKFRIQKSEIRNEAQKTIITISRLVSKNGIDILIRAVAEAKKQLPDLRCRIIGDGPEAGKLKSLVYDLGLGETIEFLGAISHKELPRYLREADVFVRPSRSEGMGNAFVEALAAGVPVIGTQVGGITDIIEDKKTGLFARVEDPHDLAEKIVMLCVDEALQQKIIYEGGRIVEERFSWDAIARLYQERFKRLGETHVRILVATGLFPPEIGGPATYSHVLTEELPRRNVAIRVAPFRSVRKLPKLVRHCAYTVKLMVAGRGADNIFAQDPVSVGIPAAIAALFLRKKFVLKVVGDYAWEQHQLKFQNAETIEEFQKKRHDVITELRKRAECWVARRAEKVIVPSEFLKHIVVQWGVLAHRITVVYNAFEPPCIKISREEARAKLGLKGFVIFSAGRFVPWKGFEGLVRMMSDLVSELPDARLVVAGSGPQEAALRVLVVDLHLEDHVFFIGSVAQETLLRYFAASDVFVLNSGYEGFSHTLLEAMSMGVPVIASKRGGTMELIEEGKSGFLVEYNKSSEIISALRALHAMPQELRNALVEAGILRAQSFPRELMIGETLAVLTQIHGAERRDVISHGMKVFMCSSDPKIFDESSDVRRRMREYAELFSELYVISVADEGARETHEGRLHLYPVSAGAFFLRPFLYLRAAFRILRLTTCDVVSAQGADEIGVAAFLAARWFRIPFRLELHTDVMSPWYRRASWKEYMRYVIARFLIPRADRIRVVSQRIKKSLLESGICANESRISVLPIYSDVSQFIRAARDQKTDARFRDYSFKMIAAGRFVEKEKNFLMLIDMMAEFIKICPTALLVIVGEGPDRGTYESGIAFHGLEKNVLIEQWRNDLFSFYKSFDLFLLSSNYEGWGRAVIEAMAAGLPVVMTDVGLAGEIVKDGENGAVIPVGSRKALLRAVGELYKNYEKRILYAKNARETVYRENVLLTKEMFLARYTESFRAG